jgi:hypothetical protein
MFLGAILVPDTPPSAKKKEFHPYCRPSLKHPLPSCDTGEANLSSVLVPESPLSGHLDGSKSYLLTEPILDRMGLVYHMHFKAILCLCGKAVSPDSVFTHVEGHGVAVIRPDKNSFADFAGSHPCATGSSDIQHPAPGGPPVEILKQISNGFCCNYCSYCAPEKKSFSNHWYQKHSKTEQALVDQRFHIGTLQTFFHPVGVQYFEVNPELAHLSDDDAFAIYLRDIVPQYKPFPATLPTHAREVPPLLQVTQWHIHLAEYSTDHQKWMALRSLITLPSWSTSIGINSLGPLIFQYLKDIRQLANRTTLSMRCLLMECPR